MPADQVALELKSPCKDGTTWISMSADTFLERLASLVPRPRTNQVRYRGVLHRAQVSEANRAAEHVAHSARRPQVVPEPDDDPKDRPKNATFCELMKHGLNVRRGHRAQGERSEPSTGSTWCSRAPAANA